MSCSAVKKNGAPCTFRAKENGLCGVHSNSEGDCPVCYDSMRKNNSIKLECGHVFHKKCMRKWLSSSKRTCPLCRDNITSDVFEKLELSSPPLRNTSSTEESISEHLRGLSLVQRIQFNPTIREMRGDVLTEEAYQRIIRTFYSHV